MREGLIAFTLGELGILTAFVLVFALSSEVERSGLSQQEADSLRVELKEARSARGRLETRVVELDSIVQALQDSVRVLRGPQLPSCRQAGLTEGFLLRATVIGPDRFLVESDTLTLAGIERVYSSNLHAAQDICVHQALVIPSEGVTTSAFVQGLNRLGLRFYVRAESTP